MKKTYLLVTLVCLMGTILSASGQEIYSTGFKATDDNAAWSLYSGSTNGWHIGKPTSEDSDTAWLYIDKEGGSTNTYDITEPTCAWACHDVTLAGGVYTFSYRWKCWGEGKWDYLRCVLMPDTTSPDTTCIATYKDAFDFGNRMDEGWVSLSVDGNNLFYNNAVTWEKSSVTFAVPPGNYKIAFIWVNDESGGNQPPAVIDDVSLMAGGDCPQVSNLQLNHISYDSAELSWSAIYGAQYLVQIGEQPPVLVDTNRYVILYNMTTYSANVKVSAICAAGDTTDAVQKYFSNYANNIGCSGYTLPFTEDFDIVSYFNDFYYCWWMRHTTLHDGLTMPEKSLNDGVGGSDALRLARNMGSNSFGSFYSPYFDAPANQLDITFWMRVSSADLATDALYLHIGVADHDIDTAANNVVFSTSLVSYGREDLDTVWQLYHLTTDTIDMSVIDGDVRLAFVWGGTTNGIYIDDLQVTLLAPDTVPPVVSLSAPSMVYTLDTIVCMANLLAGTDSALTYSWQSSMAAMGQATILSANNSFRLIYNAPGTDTLTLIAVNPYGSDTVTETITVAFNPQVPQVDIVGYSEAVLCDTAFFNASLISGDTTDLTFDWKSHMVAQGNAEMVVEGASLGLIYLTVGVDTVTVTATNAFGSGTSTFILSVTACDTVWRTVSILPMMENDTISTEIEQLLASQVHGAGVYADGDTVTVSGDVNGCEVSFVYWVTCDGDTIYDNPYSFVVTSDVTLTAVFKEYGGIDNVASTFSMLYPNPTTGRVILSLGNYEDEAEVIVLSIDGRVVMQCVVQGSGAELNLSGLMPGSYFVQVRTARWENVSKLIVR